MRGAHQGFDCRASFLITPPNFASGAGSCLPSIEVVAPGEPGVPVTCCDEAVEDTVPNAAIIIAIRSVVRIDFIWVPLVLNVRVIVNRIREILVSLVFKDIVFPYLLFLKSGSPLPSTSERVAGSLVGNGARVARSSHQGARPFDLMFCLLTAD